MSDLIATAGTPEIALGSGTPPTGAPHQVSSSWADMEKDLAAIAAEQAPPAQPASSPAAVTPRAPQAVAPQTPPPPPVVPVQAAAAPAEVPEKFRDASGKLDQEKLVKSYIEAEKALKRAQNNQAQPAAPAPVVPAAPIPQGPVTLSPFERQVAQDLINDAAALGYAMPEGLAISTARTQIRLMEAKHQADKAATFAKVSQFEETLAEQNSRRELEALSKDNAWVLTPQGYKDLIAIQAEKPWAFKESPTPWADAVEILLGRRAKSGQQGLVNTPNPTGAQNGAPPLPVTPTPVAPTTISLNTEAEIKAHLANLKPEQEAEFWKKAGLKWDTPKQFRGI